MTFYKRYIKGETEEVYREIQTLEQAAFLPTNLPDIENVLTETFQRVACNLDIIYAELKNTYYLFKTEFNYNFERPLHKPLPETLLLLDTLDRAVKPFGFVPLSLTYFYRLVGSVNFVWDYSTSEDFRWQLADPVQIISLDALVEAVTDKYWFEEMEENVAEGNGAFLELAADALHKDNVSGGPAYSLEITRYPSIDSLFINEPNETTFINYLRICFDNCGFPGIRSDNANDYQPFFGKVQPRLKPI